MALRERSCLCLWNSSKETDLFTLSHFHFLFAFEHSMGSCFGLRLLGVEPAWQPFLWWSGSQTMDKILVTAHAFAPLQVLERDGVDFCVQLAIRKRFAVNQKTSKFTTEHVWTLITLSASGIETVPVLLLLCFLHQHRRYGRGPQHAHSSGECVAPCQSGKLGTLFVGLSPTEWELKGFPSKMCSMRLGSPCLMRLVIPLDANFRLMTMDIHVIPSWWVPKLCRA